jgi:hypothetical protein
VASRFDILYSCCYTLTNNVKTKKEDMTEVTLGDKVKIEGWSEDPNSLFEGREGVVSHINWNGTYKVTFDDGIKFPRIGNFTDKMLTKIEPKFAVGDMVSYRNNPATVISIKTFAAPGSTTYSLKFSYGGTISHVAEKDITAVIATPDRKFNIGQKVRYIGDGAGVFPEYQKDGTVHGYTSSGSVKVSIDGRGFVVHRESDIESILEEGKEINAKDLKVGMEVRVEYVTEQSGYIQTSTKQGVIARITDGVPQVKIDDHQYVSLRYYGVNHKYILVKNAPEVDPHLVTAEKLAQGSVVQFRDSGRDEPFTYVKTWTQDEWWAFSGNMVPVKVPNTTIAAALKQDNVTIMPTNITEKN